MKQSVKKRTKPTYNWEWYEKHTPFKKILEELCDLKIDKEYIPYQVFGNIWNRRIHYNITLNTTKLINNLDTIRERILSTRVCKNNSDVHELVCKQLSTTQKSGITQLIIEGCLVFESAGFSWNFIEE